MTLTANATSKRPSGKGSRAASPHVHSGASPPAAARRETALRAGFRQAGVDALELSTGDTLIDAVLRFADLRKRRSQLAAGGGLPQHLGPA